MGKLTVDMKALKREIAKLNKTGILEEVVDASGDTKDIVEKFCDAVEQAREKDVEDLKKVRSVVETYNDLVDQLDKFTETETEVEEITTLIEEPIKEIKKKVTKKSKEKKEKETLATIGGKKKAEKEEKVVKEKAPKKEKVVKAKVSTNGKKSNVRDIKGALPWDEFTKAEKKFISWIGVDLMNNRGLKANSLKCWKMLEKEKKEEYLAKYKEKKFLVPVELK